MKLMRTAVQVDKINFENEKKLMKLVKKMNIELFHQQLNHLRKKTLKHVLKAVKDIEIQSEFSDNCKVCTHAEKTRVQN